MSTPGVSLFQGAESMKVNTTLERAEEEEALEDQRRRNEELGNLLQNAFDDLDDDETTIDSTTNFQSDLLEQPHQQQQNYQQQQQQQQQQQEHLQLNAHNYEEEIEKLKILLDSRAHELANKQQMANDEYKKRDELQKRLMIAEAELDRALASKGNTHELLVESKEKCSRLEDTIDKVRAEKKSLESENNTLLGKLETAHMMLADVQRKYDMVERDMNRHSERHAETKRKQMEDRHRAEVDMMQQQMDQLIDKVDKKTQELENMSTRYQALQSNHELMLVDKASKINDLSRALDEAQKQCDDLLSRPDYHLENMRLQKLVASLHDQIAGMEKTIGQLTERLEYTSAELDVMDSVLHQHNLEDTPKTHGRVVGSTPLNTNDRIGNLKDELFRALANVKSKREEVRKLEQLLEEKNTELRELRKEENKSLVQITTLKEDKLRLENRLKLLEEEQNDSKAADMQIDALKEQLQSVQSQQQLWLEERRELHEAKAQLEEEARKVTEQLRDLQVDFEELKQETDNLRRIHDDLQSSNLALRNRMASDNTRLELERHKFLLKDSKAECDRLKNLYVEICNVKEAVTYELKKLRETDTACEMQQMREKVATLQRALQLAEVKATELAKLLDAEKLRHEQDVQNLKEKLDKDRSELVKQAVKDSSNNCSKCIDYMAEVSKAEIQNLKLSSVNAISKQEIDDLQEQLKQSQALIEQLEEKLRLSEQQEQQIIELKSKAHQFEEYIKTHSTSPSSASEKSPGAAAEAESHEILKAAEIKRLEARMREEMAKIFANELKKMQTRLHQTEDRFVCVQREYEHVHVDLQQRQTEVNLLKQAILAEREKMAELLIHKDTKYSEVMQQLQKIREELHAKTKRIVELARELDERQAQIEAERQSMKAVMQQWEEQRKCTDDIEKEWRMKLEELKETHEKQIEAWQTKYNSAKRTAANYKRYSEDKEAHMLKEYDRIKLEYDSSLMKIELRMKETIEKKNREIREAIIKNDKNRDMGHDKENRPKN